MSKRTLILSNESKTLSLGALLASVCIQSCTIYLNGCVGAGKSVFCRGFLRGLGYLGRVNSPTYTLIEYYVLTHCCVCHFDFYRLISVEELEYMGVRDYFNNSYTICLIEWPIQGLRILPTKDISVIIDYCDNKESRKITIESVSNLGNKMLAALSGYWKLYT